VRPNIINHLNHKDLQITHFQSWNRFTNQYTNVRPGIGLRYRHNKREIQPYLTQHTTLLRSHGIVRPNITKPLSRKNLQITHFQAKSAISAKWRKVAQKAEVISRQDCGELDGTALLALPRITSAHCPEISRSFGIVSSENSPGNKIISQFKVISENYSPK